MADEADARGRRAPAPPPRHPARPPEPRPRTLSVPQAPIAPDIRSQIQLPQSQPTQFQPPRLIRPSEHLAIVESHRSMERRQPHLVPAVTVLQGPRPSLPQPPPPLVHRPVIPPPLRMPAPPPVTRLPQPRREIQVSLNTCESRYYLLIDPATCLPFCTLYRFYPLNSA